VRKYYYSFIILFTSGWTSRLHGFTGIDLTSYCSSLQSRIIYPIGGVKQNSSSQPFGGAGGVKKVLVHETSA